MNGGAELEKKKWMEWVREILRYSMDLLSVKGNSKVIVDSGDDCGNKFEEQEEVLVHSQIFTTLGKTVTKSFHHFSMSTWVNEGEWNAKVRMFINSYRFMCMFLTDILKDVFCL